MTIFQSSKLPLCSLQSNINWQWKPFFFKSVHWISSFQPLSLGINVFCNDSFILMQSRYLKSWFYFKVYNITLIETTMFSWNRDLLSLQSNSRESLINFFFGLDPLMFHNEFEGGKVNLLSKEKAIRIFHYRRNHYWESILSKQANIHEHFLYTKFWKRAERKKDQIFD